MLDANSLFAPTRALTSAQDRPLFVGRTELLDAACNALEPQGASLVLSGPRGIGKTSFAGQLMSRLCGRESPGSKRPVRCVWFSCSEETPDVNRLVLRLLRPSRSEYSSTLR